jgi:hypothetical protein
MLKTLSTNSDFQPGYAADAAVVEGLQSYAFLICLTNKKLPDYTPLVTR